MKGLNNPEYAELITEKAAKVFNANPKSESRRIENVFARMAVFYNLKLKEETVSAIAFAFDKHHASVLHSIKSHQDNMQYDKKYQALYAEFLNEIGEKNTSKTLTLLEAKKKIVDAVSLLKSISYDTEPFDNFLKVHYDTAI